MSGASSVLDEEPEGNTRFVHILRWRVHAPEEALGIAATHRRRAAEARQAIPVPLESFHDHARALGLEQRAVRHDAMAEACERHAARLRTAATNNAA